MIQFPSEHSKIYVVLRYEICLYICLNLISDTVHTAQHQTGNGKVSINGDTD